MDFGIEDSEVLILYHFRGCPYCDYVDDVLDDLGLEIEHRDIRVDSGHREDLRRARGRTTVPVLRICQPGGDRWMPESRDIALYLQQRFGPRR